MVQTISLSKYGSPVEVALVRGRDLLVAGRDVAVLAVLVVDLGMMGVFNGRDGLEVRSWTSLHEQNLAP